MLEWLIPIIVDNVSGYILDQSGLGEQIRSKFENKPVKEAFQRSLQKTFVHFERLYPQLAAEDLFRQSFQERECALILAQLLLRNRQYNPDALANLWADALYKQQPAQRAIVLYKLEPVAREFLNYLDNTLQTEEALRQIHDSQALERASSGITELSKDVHAFLNLYIPPDLSKDKIQEQCQEYCRKLYDQWKMLDFKGIQQADPNRPVSIPLTDVFVLPDVLSGMPEYETLERDERQKRDLLKEEEREYFARRDQKASKDKQVVVQREDLHTVLLKYRRLIILGDPGSGKSTLLRYLMLTLAENSPRFSNEFPQLASDAYGIIPLYIPLASYAESWLSHGVEERSLKDFLPKHLRYTYLDTYTSTIERQLEQGRLLILLDGLDEIPDASLRMQIVRQIEIFTQSYPQNRFIVTSRIVGYKDAPLAVEYQAYTLADFNEEQIKTFTTKWCPAYERWVNQVEDSQSLQDAATKEAEKLFRATRLNEGVKRLAVNPLLLTILALIQRQGIELPSHRVELFDLCITTLLETWIKAKGPVGAVRFGKNDFIKILRPLAFWMHKHPAVGAIPEDELLEQIVRQLLERRAVRSEDEAQQQSEQFLQTVRGKTGILIERGKRRYGFLHLTFEEYFAAWDLVMRKKNRDDFIKQHLHDPRWQVVILLTVGIIGILQSDEEGVTELVEEAILKAKSPFEKWLHRDLLLAGLCLADDIGISAVCEDTIIEQVIYIYLTSPYNSLRTQFLSMFDGWKGTSVAAKAIDLVLSAINEHEHKFGISHTSSTLSLSFSNTCHLGEKFNAFHQQLVQQNQESSIRLVHLAIIIGLCHSTDMSDRIQYVLKALSDPNHSVRQAAATALGQIRINQPEVIEALLKLLSDSHYSVQEAAATALGQVGANQPEVIEALLKALFNCNYSVEEAIVTALGQVGANQPEVIEALLKALSRTYFPVRQAAARVLGQMRISRPEVIEALLKLLSDSNSSVQLAAATALGQVGANQPEVIEALLKLLSDSEWFTRQAAATALGQVGASQPKVIEALLKLLSDPNSSVRQAVARAIGQMRINQPEVIEALLKALLDSEWSVRQAAVTALGQVGINQPEVIEALLKLLSDIDSDVRRAVATALGQVGTNHAEVIEALFKALSDMDAEVRSTAAITLSTLLIDNTTISLRIEEMLSNYQPIISKQIIADDLIESLRFTLQQIA